jgi:hypothetical protein
MAVGIVATVRIGTSVGRGMCRFTSADNDKARAEALATCRAIVAALKAKEE